MPKFLTKTLELGMVLLLLAVIFLRFYSLGSYPTGIHADEASYGYDAFSLLRTTRDQWGEKYPLTFRSFGEYKLALPYLIIPAVNTFGLSTFATRLPSAIAGVITLFLLYLTLQLYHKNRLINLTLTFIFASSPWAFGLSRVFFESNTALAFYAAGYYVLSRRSLAVPTHPVMLTFGIISLGLSGYFYAPFRFISFATLLLALYLRRLAALKLLLLYLLVSLPILTSFVSRTGLTRLLQESGARVFESSLVISENLTLCGFRICQIFWNTPVMQFEGIIKTIFSYLSPNYLFLTSVDNYILPPDTGAYLYYLFPFFLVGVYRLLKHPDSFYLGSLVICILVVSSAAKLSLYRNSAGLYLCFFPLALGLHHAFAWLKKTWQKTLLYPLIIGMFFGLTVYLQARYLTHYFRIYRYQTAGAWSADAREVATYIHERIGEYRTVIDRSADDFGILYYAFYTNLDPAVFQLRAERTAGDRDGWTHVGKLGNHSSMDPRSLENLLCEKAAAPQNDLSALYITAPLPDYSRFATHVSRDLSGHNILHEFYDLDDLYSKLEADNPANIPRLCPIETKTWER